METELNKKLLYAINSCDKFYEFDTDTAANECEKICLQSQIDLLREMWVAIQVVASPSSTLRNKQLELQEQLNQLK